MPKKSDNETNKKNSNSKTNKTIANSANKLNNKKQSNKNTQNEIINVEIENDNLNKDSDITIKSLKKEYFGLKEVIGIIIITAIVGFVMGFSIKQNKDVSSLSRYEKQLLENYNDILDYYYKNIDYLDDPYATYISQNDINDFNITIYGEYEGIGIEVGYNDENQPIIVSIFPNSPADISGLRSGDILLYIEDISVINKSLDEIKDIINTLGNNEFKIIYQRNGEENEAILKRDKIVIESVEEKIYEQDNQKIGYLKINNFAQNSDEQFNEKLLDLEKNEINSLIIDLRNNTGGELESAHNIVSLFIPKDEVIYQLKEKDKITKYYSDGNANRKYKIVVLTNEFSASASELTTAALKEVYNATIIGTKTFGKGTGQQVVTLENGEKYKFTTKEWLTAKGNSIDGIGIEPNINVEQSSEYLEFPTEENDVQLSTALDFLCK